MVLEAVKLASNAMRYYDYEWYRPVIFLRHDGNEDGNLFDFDNNSGVDNKREELAYVSLYGPGVDIRNSRSNLPPESEVKIDSDRYVWYEQTYKRDILHISYHCDYLDKLQNRGFINGTPNTYGRFEWSFPQLSVKLLNNTDRTVFLTEATLEVVSSRIVEEPVLIVDDLSLNGLRFTNEGWGKVIAPKVQFSIIGADAESDMLLFAPQVHTVLIENFEDEAIIPLQRYVPERLRSKPIVKVSGQIVYGKDNDRKTLKFATRVSFRLYSGRGVPPSYEYQAFFKAGEAPVTRHISIAQEIQPGEVEHFLLCIGTDKTCCNHLNLSFKTIDRKVIQAGVLALDIFVARTQFQPY